MVAQVKAISRRDSVDIAARFERQAAQLRERVLMMMADDIVRQSPIDTGTYILAHRADVVGGDPTEGGSRSSHGKRRGVPDAQFRNLARGNLMRSVSSAAVSASEQVFFRNVSEHAGIVEYVHGFAVYAQVRNAAPAYIRQAAAELGMDAR
jgi:hypothetical protein